MYNEAKCCKGIIDSCCSFIWPMSRLFIQIVDDSSDPETISLVDKLCDVWKKRGINIVIQRRSHRQGFKAGALNNAMEYLPPEVEYIAIFDADFLPETGFITKTIPYLVANPRVAFLQTRWKFTNSNDSMLTRLQEISLNYHFECEQESRFRAGLFFNFNGTAGIWRRNAIEDSGGWQSDTLVEDLDLSLRAWLANWDFLYMNHIECLNEIPPTLKAYRSQQHRWTSGPMQVFNKVLMVSISFISYIRISGKRKISDSLRKCIASGSF
jgi:beta-mannan synthase